MGGLGRIFADRGEEQSERIEARLYDVPVNGCGAWNGGEITLSSHVPYRRVATDSNNQMVSTICYRHSVSAFSLGIRHRYLVSSLDIGNLVSVLGIVTRHRYFQLLGFVSYLVSFFSNECFKYLIYR